jgi:CRP-like cAMP-binding protein
MLRRRTDVPAFAGVPLFAGYGGRDLAPLAAHADRLTLPPGAALAQAGRRPHEVVVLLSGQAEVAGGQDEGRALGPGAVVGALEELTGAPHAVTVVATETVSALVLAGPAFRWAVQALPGFRDRLAAPTPEQVPSVAAIASAA